MPNYLCISVTFLDPYFHGKGDDGPEWPPSPFRLYQALIAGTRAGCRRARSAEEESAALRWLERLEPPLIVAPEAALCSSRTHFVPNNDSDKRFSRQARLTTKVFHAHCLQGGETLHYIWSFDSHKQDNMHAAATCDKIARYVTSLGWGIDQVAATGRVIDEIEMRQLKGVRWKPWRLRRPQSRKWRVPVQGSFEDLEAVYASFRARVQGRHFHPGRTPKQFDLVEYFRTTQLAPRPYAVFEFSEGVAFGADRVAQIAAAARAATCRAAKAGSFAAPGGAKGYVLGQTVDGHDPSERFSFLPLPTIGHRHADGRIRRLLIAEPLGGSGSMAAWAENRLLGESLGETDGAEGLILHELWRPSSRRVVQRYVGEALEWVTVTPVVLPGFDDGSWKKAERLLVRALTHAGVPLEAVGSIELRKGPFFPGAPHAHAVRVPEYLRGYARWHVSIRFREPVPGPISIGAGRYLGLGLFAHIE